MAESEALERARQFFRDMVPDGEPTMQELRDSYVRHFGKFPVPDDASIEEVDAGGVPCIWISAPGTSAKRTIVYYHGGGYCMGRAQCYKSLGYGLSKQGDARVLLVDYRLAPEHPHPAAVDDAVTAYEWARQQAPDSSFVLCGDSAGGGLATATCMALRDTGKPVPDACVVMSPFADLSGESQSMKERAPLDPIVQPALVEVLGGAYLAGKDPKQTPLASPVFARDFSGLPPFFILVGTAEALYDDSITLHKAIEAAGGHAELDIGDDMIHVYPVFASFLPEAQSAVEKMGAFIKSNS